MIEGIVPAHDPANVAQYFKRAAADHGNREADKSARESGLQNEAAQRQREEGEERGIGWERWLIRVVGLVEGACLQCTSSPVGGQLFVVTPEEAVEGLHYFVLFGQKYEGNDLEAVGKIGARATKASTELRWRG